MKQINQFARIYFYKKDNFKEPKLLRYPFNYSKRKSILGFSSLGFYFDLPLNENADYHDAENFISSMNKSSQDMLNSAICSGVRLYSLIYGKKMHDLSFVFIRFPNGECVKIKYTLQVLLGDSRHSFDCKWRNKSFASKIISIRTKDKMDNSVIDSLIKSGHCDDSFTKFATLYPGIEAFLNLKGDDIGVMVEFHKKYFKDEISAFVQRPGFA